MKKIAVITTGVVLVAAVTGAAIAGVKYHDHDDDKCERYGMNGHKMERIAEHLALNQQQQEMLGSTFETLHEKRKEARENRRSFRQQLDALDPESPDYVSAVEKLAKDNADSMVAKAVGMAEAKAQLYAVLTDEQELKLEKLKERKHKKSWGDDKDDDDDYRHHH